MGGKPLTRAQGIRFLAVGLAYFLTALLEITLTSQGDNIAVLWPPNAILIGVLLRAKSCYRPVYFGICLLADLVASKVMGEATSIALGFMLANGLAVAVTVAFMQRLIPLPVTLHEPWQLLALVGAGLLGTAVGAAFIGVTYGTFYWAAWPTWWLADVVSIALITPVLLSASWPVAKTLLTKRTAETAAALLIAAAVTVGVFHSSSYALVYLTAPVMLWFSFRLGLFACGVLGLVITIIVVALTLQGVGPIASQVGGISLTTIQTLQIYLSLVILPALMISIERENRLRAEAEIIQSQARYRSLYHDTPAMLHSIDRQGRLLSVSAYWLTIMGYERDEVIGRRSTDFMTDASRRYAIEVVLPAFMRSGVCRDIPYQMVKKNGEVFDVLLSATAEHNPDGSVAHSLTVMHDVTARKRAETALVAEKERAQVTLESIGDGVITTDANGRINYLNPIAEAMTGWLLAAAQDKALQEVFQIINESTCEPAADPLAPCLTGNPIVRSTHSTVLINRHGTEYSIEISAAPIRDSNRQVLGAVLVFHDVSEQRRLQREIAHQAQHDALTGLVNRREFEQRLQRVIEAAQTQNSEHALCYLDLDQFKVVNDTCGHTAGDSLLQQLATLFEKNIRRHDTLARLGGDEFGLLLEHCPLDSALRIVNTLRQTVEDFRFCWNGQYFRIGVSIGLVPINSANSSVASVLRAADSACYVAKDSGRNRIHIYREHDVDLARRHGEMQWVARIQQALEEDRFQLYAQPIVPFKKLPSGGIHCELLLRLVENDGKISPPGAFMPAAERYNLAVAIDRWVVSQALRWLATHPALLDRIMLCTINLSGRSIGDRFFHAYVLRQFDDTGLSAKKICFEITETAAVANLADATRFMQALKKRGCRFSLDDFGSGLSSFAYLKALPVDFLKIDGLFVKDIVHDPIDLAMVRSINEIGHLLGKKTVAEYVENNAILDKLRNLGIDYGQGYGLGRPQPLSALLKINPRSANSIKTGADAHFI
ncbi:EAL domain-containing protein [Nitrosococcus watsonii]|uniref:Diguanylate cyclase/phosphodiesterase with PAS/PAC sensor(S) n=1 Tax=Nitrosococcus watsoni (strain C-113) TaxID=105559 RepID=D8KBI9_NITWC|nr:EAL domain-containing protein [Nitrosococcus watsonii]ADJ29636.1 diguanylate cyclase/phosphodiesterase with PAS/PAC sensor(s) [Nitrosococcus watsonii C-113]